MKQIVRPIILGLALIGPGLATPAMAASSADATAVAASTLSGSVAGRGQIATDDGTATFRIEAKPEVGAAGHHGDFRYEVGSTKYNGAIHTYSVSENTATIQGAGAITDANGRHHVTFTLVVTAGGAGTGAMAVTFSGKDYSDHYAATLTSGNIVVRSMAAGN